MPIGTKRTTFTVGAFTPDYDKLIANDPRLVQGLADMRASSDAERSRMQLGLDSGAARLGFVPEGMEGISEEGRRLAELNTREGLSYKAQIDRNHQNALRQIQQNLAGTGMFDSGANARMQIDEAQRNKGELFEAMSNFADYANGMRAAFAQAEAQRQRQAGDMRYDAAQRQMELNPATPGAPMQAAHLPGLGVFRGADGQIYRKDGKPLSNKELRALRRPLQQQVAGMRNRQSTRGAVNWNAIKNTDAFRNFDLVSRALGLDVRN